MLSTIQSNWQFYLQFYLETAEKYPTLFNLFKSKFIDRTMNIFIVMLIQIFFVFSPWRLFFPVCWIRTAYVLILCSEPAYSLGKRAGLFCMYIACSVKEEALQCFLCGELNTFCWCMWPWDSFLWFIWHKVHLSAPWLFFTQSVGDFTFLKCEISRFGNNKCQLIIKCHNLILYVLSSYRMISMY